jgi:hypothetical protein
MIPFVAYSEEQRSRIAQCFMSVMEKNPDMLTATWTERVLRPITPEKMQQFYTGEESEFDLREQRLNAIINKLERHARCYEADTRWESAVSKDKLEEVATLCAKLADVLPSFNLHPHLLGLGVNREQRTVNGKIVWDLSDPQSSINADTDFNKGTDELLALIDRLSSIKDAVSKGIFLVGASASKRARNQYLKKVFNIWRDAGGVGGGPNSAMVKFFRAVCVPVLGNNYPTDDALVKLANDLAKAKGTTTKLKPLKLSKIKG